MLQFWSVASGYQDIRRLSLSLSVSSASISRVATTSSSIVHVPSSAGRYGMPSIANLLTTCWCHVQNFMEECRDRFIVVIGDYDLNFLNPLNLRGECTNWS